MLSTVYLLAALSSPVLFAFMDASLLGYAVFLAVQLVLNFLVTVVLMHYQTHVKLFSTHTLNRVYEIGLSISSGSPFHAWTWFHSVHHQFSNDRKHNDTVGDPISTYRHTSDNTHYNVWKYITVLPMRDLTGASVADKDNTCRSKFWLSSYDTLKAEVYWFYGYLALIAAINLKVFATYLLIVLIGYSINYLQNFGEHYGNNVKGSYGQDAASYYGRFYNMVTLNAGYHQEHHVSPNTHWSELPGITSTLPADREILSVPHLLNAPFATDFKRLLNVK